MDWNNSSIGCFLKVNLHYSDEMHDLQSDYPVAHEKTEVKKDMLSGYQVQIIERNNFSLGLNKVNSQSRQ